jgi:hypothetical protein
MSLVVRTSAGREPTLGELLTHFARTGVSKRLYVFLQLGLPVAFDFGVHGYPRVAAWGIALASLGAWGLADRWLFARPAAAGLRATLTRYARAVTGALAAVIPALLLLELFLRLLGNAPIS